MSNGFASNLHDALPNASFIGFTGTPIEKTDANTRSVFGDYIAIYDIHRAFEALSHKVVDLQLWTNYPQKSNTQ
jgi:type I site-specific restriction-modification system R (restriction) subunit